MEVRTRCETGCGRPVYFKDDTMYRCRLCWRKLSKGKKRVILDPWHGGRWKRRRDRWNRKLMGIRPSYLIHAGIWVGLFSIEFPASMDGRAGMSGWGWIGWMCLWALGALVWKVAAERAWSRKRRWIARQRRRALRRRREADALW